MLTIKNAVKFVAVLASCILTINSPGAQARNGNRRFTSSSSTLTQVYIENKTATDVQASIVLPIADSKAWANAPHNVNDIYTVDAQDGTTTKVTQFADNILNGFFTVKSGHKLHLTANGFTGWQGIIIAFGTFHVCPCFTPNCPSFQPGVSGPSQPNGVTGCEFSLNAPPGFGEACDVSCVNGCNARVQMTVVPVQNGPFWTTDGGNEIIRDTVHSENSWVDIANKLDDNCKRKGVFPYNHTDCLNSTSQSLPCTPNVMFCDQTTKTCQFDRSAGPNNSFGGDIIFSYEGPLQPPARF